MEQWDVIRVHCTQIPRPHDKYCISVIPKENGFFFINSEPPRFRKAREVAVEIANHELHCIQHNSFVDTTTVEYLLLEEVTTALAEPDRHFGQMAPFLRQRIVDAVNGHGVLTPDEIVAITG